MDGRDARAYLLSIRRISKQIQSKEDRLMEIEEIDLKKAINYEKENIMMSEKKSPEEDLVIRHEELILDITDQKIRLIHEKNAIENELSRFKASGKTDGERKRNEQYGDILIKRYVDGKYFEQIAMDMHLTYNYVRQQHRPALEAFGKYMG